MGHGIREYVKIEDREEVEEIRFKKTEREAKGMSLPIL